MGTGDRERLARDWYLSLRVLALSQTLDPDRAERLVTAALPRFVSEAGRDMPPERLVSLAGKAVRDTAREDPAAFGPEESPLAAVPAAAAVKVRERNWRLEEVFAGVPAARRGTALLEAAARLPDRARVLLLLKYVEGLDYAALGRAAGLRPEEVGPGLASARRLLERSVADALRKAAAR